MNSLKESNTKISLEDLEAKELQHKIVNWDCSKINRNIVKIR